ncbi:MAG: PQQ-binding-like beta-propeller repeat protein [Cellulomonadaceae bacterium]|nr:PQQ-binding-like beta-propeller repeat protein [Cellulomonadaceae bacterium]
MSTGPGGRDASGGVGFGPLRREPGQQYVDVELEESESDDLDDEGGEGRPPNVWVLRAQEWSPRAVRAAAVLGAVVLLLVVVSSGWTTAQRARLAQVAGLAGDLDTPLVPVWTVEDVTYLAVTGDVVVLRAGSNLTRGDGASAVRPDDGRVLWHTEGSGACAVATSASGASLISQQGGLGAPVDPDAARVVCLQTRTVTSAVTAADGDTTTTAVQVLDPLTGQALGSAVLPGGELLSVVDGPDVVVAGVEPGGTVTVERWSAWTGEPLWTYRSAEPVAVGGGLPVVTWLGPTLQVAASRSITISLSTGAEVDPAVAPAPDATGPAVVLADGGVVRTTAMADGAQGIEVRDADGSVRFTAVGHLVAPTVDDGSVPAVLVVQDPEGRLHGLDTTTGEPLWVGAEPALAATLRVDGVLVVVMGSGHLQGIALADGTQLWEVGNGVTIPSAVTDGHIVLTLEPTGMHVDLVARGLRDGAERWRATAPGAATRLVTLPDGVVVVQSTTGVVALRTPD